MNSKVNEERLWLVIGSLMVLAGVALAMALSYTEPVMVPFVLAIFLVTIVSPVIDFLVVRWRFPRSAAITVALLLVLTVMVIFVLILIFAVQQIGATATEYSDRFSDLARNVFHRMQGWFDWLEARRIVSGEFPKTMDELENTLLSELQVQVPLLLSQALGTVTSLLSTGFLVIIFVVFLLAGRQSPPASAGVYADIESAVRRYITTKTLLSAITGILCWIILSVLGLPMAALFGILAFLLNYIPSIGSIIATLLPIPVAMGHFEGDFWMILLVIVLPGSVHMTIGNVIEPKIMGKGLELHPVTVLLALAAWGLLWGPVGMVLAVPITAMIRIILVRFQTTKPLGELLAGTLPGQNAVVTNGLIE